MMNQSQTATSTRQRGSLADWRKSHKPILYIPLLFFGSMFMFPFFYTFMTSLKQPFEIYVFPPLLIPEKLMWSNYIRTVNLVPFLRWMYNTVVITVLNTSGVLLTSSLAAFSFARFRYKLRDILFVITLSTMMLPAQVTLIPTYIMWFKFGEWTSIQFIDTYRPLWLPAWFGGGAFAIFLMRQFIMTIPQELDEAALIDGANYFRIFWQVVIPLCKPALATLTLITVVAQWNRFIGPLIYINSPKKFPIAVGLEYFHRTAGAFTQETTQHLLMCASVLATIFPILLFFSFQRQFVQGVVMSGIKG